MSEERDRSLSGRLVGDEAAEFEHVVGEHWSGIALFAARLLNDREAAKDVSQETFIRLWLARREMSDESVRPFLYRVARNLAADELRKRSVRARWAEQPSAESHDEDAPEAFVHTEERYRDVARAMETLAPRRREALTLAFLHDLSYKDVAKVMGISVATVRNQISSALSDLRGVLAPHRR